MPAPAWLDELHLDPDGPPWLPMGLTRCPDADWLWPDERRDDELGLRAALLDERRDDVFAALPGTEIVCAEVLVLVRGWLATYRPDLTVPVVDPGSHPLEEAGRLVQEDLCLMVEHDGVMHLDAACLCFPSHWRLADKVGRPAAAIHGPVPLYDPELRARVDNYLTRLKHGVIGVRRNWSVHDDDALFSPVPPAEPSPVTAGEVPDRLWLRSERQTLRRLASSGAVLFTIRVQQCRFGALAERPDIASAFAARLRVQPPELTGMNGLGAHLPAVLAWLDTVAG